ncbi:hypothetical protein H4R20_003138 [Coemansia guatemalensis]|uniref:RRM domain-containing protein n=1 Tax=Coemansia guatemalensis TaxID=2761395 RepID=A0A9W8I071_9FUNG|nr:hypothetical protein H4R20_003138 [Coemansia guatemalensis]
MATNLDKSLDDIINSSRQGGRRGGRSSNRNSPYSRRGGGVEKRDNKKGQQQQQQLQLQQQLQQQQAMMLSQFASAQQQQGRSGNKILIGNLDYGVTEADLRALFGQIGQVTRATLNYDRNGRSKGTGEVVFRSSSHAKMAVDKYHNVELDNRKMKIEVAYNPMPNMPMAMPAMLPQMFAQPAPTAPSEGNAGRKSGGGNANTNAQGGRGGRRRGGGRRGGNNGDKRPATTKEELDADLDSYMEGAEKTSA